MGWTSSIEYGRQIINHNGQSASFTCSMFLLPELNTGIAVMANVSSMLGPHSAWSMANQVKNFLLTGQAPQVDPSFRQFYLAWDGGFALLILSVLGVLHPSCGQEAACQAYSWQAEEPAHRHRWAAGPGSPLWPAGGFGLG